MTSKRAIQRRTDTLKLDDINISVTTNIGENKQFNTDNIFNRNTTVVNKHIRVKGQEIDVKLPKNLSLHEKQEDARDIAKKTFNSTANIIHEYQQTLMGSEPIIKVYNSLIDLRSINTKQIVANYIKSCTDNDRRSGKKPTEMIIFPCSIYDAQYYHMLLLGVTLKNGKIDSLIIIDSMHDRQNIIHIEDKTKTSWIDDLNVAFDNSVIENCIKEKKLYLYLRKQTGMHGCIFAAYDNLIHIAANVWRYGISETINNYCIHPSDLEPILIRYISPTKNISDSIHNLNTTIDKANKFDIDISIDRLQVDNIQIIIMYNKKENHIETYYWSFDKNSTNTLKTIESSIKLFALSKNTNHNTRYNFYNHNPLHSENTELKSIINRIDLKNPLYLKDISTNTYISAQNLYHFQNNQFNNTQRVYYSIKKDAKSSKNQVILYREMTIAMIISHILANDYSLGKTIIFSIMNILTNKKYQ